MKDVEAKNTGSEYSASDYMNLTRNELRNTVLNSGQSLNIDDQSQLFRAIHNLCYGIGDIMETDGAPPPTNGIAGIVWRELTEAEGALLVGAGGDSALSATLGDPAGGDIGRVGGHELTLSEMPAHDHISGLPLVTSTGDPPPSFGVAILTPTPAIGDTSGATNVGSLTSSSGTGAAHEHTLSELKRYGVKLWVREA